MASVSNVSTCAFKTGLFNAALRSCLVRTQSSGDRRLETDVLMYLPRWSVLHWNLVTSLAVLLKGNTFSRVILESSTVHSELAVLYQSGLLADG